jgi:hypothetical protein
MDNPYAEIIHRLEESFHRVDQDKLIRSVAQATATATADRLQIVRFSESPQETQVKPAKPVDSDQKDKAP